MFSTRLVLSLYSNLLSLYTFVDTKVLIVKKLRTDGFVTDVLTNVKYDWAGATFASLGPCHNNLWKQSRKRCSPG